MFKEVLSEVRRIFAPAAGRERSVLTRVGWFLLQPSLLTCKSNPFSFTRVAALRLFGAEIGRDVVIKPGVRVKFPWRLKMGDRSAIGEDAWLDNMVDVELGPGAVISQGAYLCTGNHDWSKPDRPLTARPITIEQDAWVGAQVNVGPGVVVGQGSIVSLGVTVVKDVEAGMLVQNGENKIRKLKYTKEE